MNLTRASVLLIAVALSSCTTATSHRYTGEIVRKETGYYSGTVYSPLAPTGEVIPAKVYIRITGGGTVCIAFPDSEPHLRVGDPGNHVVFSFAGPIPAGNEVSAARLSSYELAKR